MRTLRRSLVKKLINLIKLFCITVSVFTLSLFSSKMHDTYLYDIKGDSIVKLFNSRGSSATGFQITAASGNTYIMTNRHVCDGLQEDSEIMYKSGSNSGSVRVVYRDRIADLCLLEGADNIEPLETAFKIYNHEKVYLLGYPSGRPLSYEYGFHVGEEVIDLDNYCYHNTNNICQFSYDAYHINAISYPGNSGSPVLDIFGNVVGVLFAGRRDQPTATYIVPLDDIKRVLENN